MVLGPRKSAMPLVRDFPKMIKYFVKKNTLNNERYRDLLISILSYHGFLAVGEDAKLKFVHR